MFIVCDGSDCPYVVETREEMENSVKEAISSYAFWLKDEIVQGNAKGLSDLKAFENGLPQSEFSYLVIFEVTQAEIDGFNSYLKENDMDVQVSLSIESLDDQFNLWMPGCCCLGFISWLLENSEYECMNIIARLHDEMPEFYQECLSFEA